MSAEQHLILQTYKTHYYVM